MGLFQASCVLSVSRIITVYFAQGIVCFFFLYLAYKVLSRDKKRLNLIFAMFYLSICVGFVLNFIYAPLTDIVVVAPMNMLTNFFLFWGPTFLLVFVLILLKSEKVITSGKQILILVIYGALFVGMFFIPEGVTIEPPNCSPKWSLIFYIYTTTIVLLGSIPSIYFSIQISNKFEDANLKKKWKYFVIGVIEMVIFMILTFTSNFLANDTFRLISGLLGLILALSGAYLIYIGVGKDIARAKEDIES